jgi:hypothetical protein
MLLDPAVCVTIFFTSGRLKDAVCITMVVSSSQAETPATQIRLISIAPGWASAVRMGKSVCVTRAPTGLALSDVEFGIATL